MKKLLIIVLSGIMMIAFTQCGGNKGSKAYQNGLELYKQAEKAIKAANTCDELEQAIYDLIETAYDKEKEYTEEDKATEEEEAELNKIAENLRNLLKEKSEKLGCE